MKWVAGLAIGGLVAAMCVGMLAGLGGYFWVKSTEAKVRRGWTLVPVVVFGVDVPAGGIVTFDQISQRSVPEQLVTSSVVKPDSASYIVKQRLLVPGVAGQPILWTMFETSGGGLKAPPPEATAACLARIPHDSRDRGIDDVRARLKVKP